MLHDVPDFEQRWKFLEELKDRLEALLSPMLITAFNNHTTGMYIIPVGVVVSTTYSFTEEAVKMVQIFSEIERSSQLSHYYIGIHKVSELCSLVVACCLV